MFQIRYTSLRVPRTAAVCLANDIINEKFIVNMWPNGSLRGSNVWISSIFMGRTHFVVFVGFVKTADYELL